MPAVQEGVLAEAGLRAGQCPDLQLDLAVCCCKVALLKPVAGSPSKHRPGSCAGVEDDDGEQTNV